METPTENINASAELSRLLADVRERLEFFGELGIENFETGFVAEKSVSSEFSPAPNFQRSPNFTPANPKLSAKFPGSSAVTESNAPKTSELPPSLRRNALAATRLSNISKQNQLAKSTSSPENEADNHILKSVESVPQTEENTNKNMLNNSLFGDLTPEQKLPASSETIEEIRADIGDCVRCRLCEGRMKIVHSTGNLQSKLMFIGEAPGADEDLQGVPFVGRAGQLLTKIIEAIGMKREEVFIGNINRCRPPQNRAPQADEVKMCKPFLLREIAVVKPEIIVVLGNTATQNLLETKVGITKLRGNFQDYYGVKVMPTFHPAYLLRDPSKKRETWEDMKKVRDELAK